MTRVLVAADSAVVRAGLEALVRASPVLEVVGSSLGVVTLAQEVEEFQPDVVLLELGLEGDDAMPSALRALRAHAHACAMVVLADDPHGAWTVEALRSGVRAVLPREATGREIVSAIEAAAAGLVVLRPEAVDLLPVPPSAARALTPPQNQALTPREIEVLRMLAEGLGNKTIASRLGISEHTVKFHIGSIFSKLKASSRTEAVTIGIRQGLIML